MEMKLLFYPWLAPEEQDESVMRETSQLTKLPQASQMWPMDQTNAGTE